MLLQVSQHMVVGSGTVTPTCSMMLEGIEFRAPPVTQGRRTTKLVQRCAGYRQLPGNPDVIDKAIRWNIEYGGPEKPWPNGNAAITEGDVDLAMARPLPFQRLQQATAQFRRDGQQSGPLEMSPRDLISAAASPRHGSVWKVGRGRGEPRGPIGSIDLVIIAIDDETVLRCRGHKSWQELGCRPQIACFSDLHTGWHRW